MALLDILKLKFGADAQNSSYFLFRGRKDTYTSTALTAAKSGVTVATAADLKTIRVINEVAQLVDAGVATRVRASGKNGTKRQSRQFIVAAGLGDDVVAEIEGTEAGVAIAGLTCTSASMSALDAVFG